MTVNNEDDAFLGIPFRSPVEVTQNIFAGVHRKDVIPASVMDMMAAILFDPRDVDPLREGEDPKSRRIAGDYLSPMQRRARGAGNDPEAQEILARGAEMHEAMKPPKQSFNMGPVVYELTKQAVDRIPTKSPVAFYISARTRELFLDIRRRHKRKKRRARYSRGKQGVRPRMRCGR